MKCRITHCLHAAAIGSDMCPTHIAIPQPTASQLRELPEKEVMAKLHDWLERIHAACGRPCDICGREYVPRFTAFGPSRTCSVNCSRKRTDRNRLQTSRFLQLTALGSVVNQVLQNENATTAQ
jgi:hypothetical protein